MQPIGVFTANEAVVHGSDNQALVHLKNEFLDVFIVRLHLCNLFPIVHLLCHHFFYFGV
jgi:hypothetical protein